MESNVSDDLEFLRQHDIPQVVDAFIGDLLRARAANVFDFMIEWAQKRKAKGRSHPLTVKPSGKYPDDIYSGPAKVDVNTLRNLGPLRAMAGIWEGTRGMDVMPRASGAGKQAYVERIELQPLDPALNGPQLMYGLRYHTNVTIAGSTGTYHDQVGYWLWEPATQTIIHTIAIPRGQVVMASGKAAPDAKEFELVATDKDAHFGIRVNPFLYHAFNTVEFRIKVKLHDDGTWSYDEDTVLKIKGQAELFHHKDSNHLTKKVAEPTPNPCSV